MGQKKLESYIQEEHAPAISEVDMQELEKKKRGPPNRMNDLSYTKWMKFQKSFFVHRSFSSLVDEWIDFFTKEEWSDKSPSQSLIIGFEDYHPSKRGDRRIIDLSSVDRLSGGSDSYDFIFINLLKKLRTKAKYQNFLKKEAQNFFEKIREMLVDGHYCGILVPFRATLFPIAWALAFSGRDSLRLCDEKIGLQKVNGQKVYYCLVFRAQDDERSALNWYPSHLVLNEVPFDIPHWTIPRSPPRTQKEKEHPAKFPEELVRQFIDIFTKEGGYVLDPMVGTGSAVIAAARAKRNAVGIDINERYIEIAKKRAAEEFPKPLFDEEKVRGDYSFIVGDARNLVDIPEIRDMRFDYCITSPPYWSMLRNPGSEYQRSRRKQGLPQHYSEKERDLGNIEDYDDFLDSVEGVFGHVASKLVSGGYLTVVLKNITRHGIIYPLAWDLTRRLCKEGGDYGYVGTTLWCQNDIPVRPFAVGIRWVSNTFHHYCIHMKKAD